MDAKVQARPALDGKKLFDEVCSDDPLGFTYGGRTYRSQLTDAIAKTEGFAGVDVYLRNLRVSPTAASFPVVYVSHHFAFLGGSLGCAEGERITRAFEYAKEKGLPIVVQCKSGGARMQEGALSLMQMAKVSVAVEALRRAHLPFVSVLVDPTFGGVSASYAMQADVRVGVAQARIGFAGPAVILNTMHKMDQAAYDENCPAGFQSAEYVRDHGQLDMVIHAAGENGAQQVAIDDAVAKVLDLLKRETNDASTQAAGASVTNHAAPSASPSELNQDYDYTRSRRIDRLQCQDMMQGTIFDDFVELKGDGSVGSDPCIRGGLARFQGRRVVVVGCSKGHTPQDMSASNYGMPTPAGYRTALRLFKMAERFNLPVVTLVDTVGAWPSFEAESAGQSEAIATNLTAMAGLKVPIVTLIVGEGGSGGALGIGMGNRIAMLSGAYYGVISPEGAASILGRYKDEQHKAKQFPKDCQELARVQGIYANKLKDLGVVDEVLQEKLGETYDNCPHLKATVKSFIAASLIELTALSSEELVSQRFLKFRNMGVFVTLSADAREKILADAKGRQGDAASSRPAKRMKKASEPGRLIKYLAHEVVHGERSWYKHRAPAGVPHAAPKPHAITNPTPQPDVTAKDILDRDGPEAVATWVSQQDRVLLTDTTMRDAHQSLLATRVRTVDIIEGAKIANQVMPSVFSYECWGGATYDVCMRFLHEDPWERLRAIRKALPRSLLQMLLRGANAVGYTSYPDNTVQEFVALAAKNGLDLFRIFDCFNDVSQMKVSIDAVRKANKIAEVCICYTSDVLESDIYTLDYYKSVTKQAVDAGAHMIGIKDMAGLLKPRAAEPLMRAIREVTDVPVHFHTHDTSGGSIATAFAMARAGCDVIDFATAAMSQNTSQPSLNAFLAGMAGDPRDPGLNFMQVEPYDVYWAHVREMYAPFESGMKSGTARVYDHEIPGGQFSNLMVQCQAMGIWHRWEEVVDMYRDVNNLFGDVIKVTPSSKCVGDLALYLVTRNLTTEDVLDEKKAAAIDFPASVIDFVEGRLGFPHRGFPDRVAKNILRGRKQITGNPGASLQPADFAAEKASLDQKWGIQATPEDVISSLLYPKVFSDYQRVLQTHGPSIRHLPTPAFYYALNVGDAYEQEMRLPASLLPEAGLPLPPGDVNGELFPVTVKLTRVGPARMDGTRTLVFDVNGVVQEVEEVTGTGEVAFAGPMADRDNKDHVGAPMPGAVEKIFVSEGQDVKEGDKLMLVVAMKMEVVVKAARDGKVSELHVEEGAKVTEGALVATVV